MYLSVGAELVDGWRYGSRHGERISASLAPSSFSLDRNAIKELEETSFSFSNIPSGSGSDSMEKSQHASVRL